MGRSDGKPPEADSVLGFQSEEGSTSSGCILKAFEFGNQIFLGVSKHPCEPSLYNLYSLLWVPDPFEKLQTPRGKAMYVHTYPRDLTYTVHSRTPSRQIHAPLPRLKSACRVQGHLGCKPEG